MRLTHTVHLHTRLFSPSWLYFDPLATSLKEDLTSVNTLIKTSSKFFFPASCFFFPHCFDFTSSLLGPIYMATSLSAYMRKRCPCWPSRSWPCVNIYMKYSNTQLYLFLCVFRGRSFTVAFNINFCFTVWALREFPQVGHRQGYSTCRDETTRLTLVFPPFPKDCLFPPPRRDNTDKFI